MFGLFQGLMPLLGYFVGGLAAEVIGRYAGIVTLVILGIVGGNMIREGAEALLHAGEDEAEHAGPVAKRLTMVTILAQAFATAMDAFAVGVGWRPGGEHRGRGLDHRPHDVRAVPRGACHGPQAGRGAGDRAQVAGGIVLVLIGLKAFFA